MPNSSSIKGRARTAAEIAIENLRAKVLDLQLEDGMIMDDLYLLRWLKARGMDPDKAERMLRRVSESEIVYSNINGLHKKFMRPKILILMQFYGFD
ncbi:unnamed protein product [Allacma fusca]|uniref:CRAL/TRIO N-terminal domain-containing protein n=1 Tax=Allacma fusca TaxID=39272 RepID=A0A8J2KT68_9HEXA|nr:unnamed protein product [Allacma fusca]